MQIRLDQEGRHLTNRTSRKRRGNGEWKVFNANDDARLCPGAGGEGPAGGAGTPTEAPTPALRRAGCRNLAASRGKRAVHRGPQPQGGLGFSAWHWGRQLCFGSPEGVRSSWVVDRCEGGARFSDRQDSEAWALSREAHRGSAPANECAVQTGEPPARPSVRALRARSSQAGPAGRGPRWAGWSAAGETRELT